MYEVKEMSIKGKHITRLKNWVKRLEGECEAEREKVKAYEELAGLHSAYISILLRRLNATEQNSVVITNEEVKHAMSYFETRAYPQGNGEWCFYCEDAKG
jgi:hypothetical protein